MREQNVQVAAGQIGRSPVPAGQDFQYTLSTLGRLAEAEQFADIILKTGAEGEVTYLRDVARIELGARSQDTLARLDGRPSVSLGIYLLPGSNALDTADRVGATMRELATRFPQGLRYTIVYDTTPFIRESVNEVFHTLRDAVILVVPMCLLSALVGVALAGMDINIFVQVGFVVLVGLAAKNAILIVEFARDRQREGVSRFEAAVEAARVRLRLIVMTSFAFILGVFPLVIAQGAGAEMRRPLGTAVFAGMIGVTLFGIFLTPVFYFVVRWFIERRSGNAPDTATRRPPAEASAPAPAGRVTTIEHYRDSLEPKH